MNELTAEMNELRRSEIQEDWKLSMTVYVIVQLKMTDRAAYDRYQARFFGVFKQFKEGCWRPTKAPTCWKAVGTATRW